jgi:hypothetical protein
MSHLKKLKLVRPRLAAAACLVPALAIGVWLITRDDAKQHDPATARAIADTPARHNGSHLLASDLIKRIEGASVAEYPLLMRLALRLEDPSQADIIASLMKLWFKSDMQSFVAFLDEIEIAGGQSWERLAPAMIAGMKNLDDEGLDPHVLREIIERVILNAAGTDPQSALSWARQYLEGDNLDSALTGISSELAKVDPEAAMNLVSEITALANRMEAAVGVGAVIGANDPERGLSWANSFPREADKAFAMSGVLSGLAGLDAGRAALEYLEIAGDLKERYRQQVLADRAAAGTTAEEEYEGLSPEEILKAELARPNPNLIYLERAAFLIGSSLAAGNPQAALDWAGSLDIYQGRVVAYEAIYGQWASSEPEAAFESYQTLDSRRPELADRLFSAWATAAPEAASRAVLTLPAGRERDAAIGGVARGWIDSGAATAPLVRWSEGLEAASEQDRVRAVVASEAAFDNPVFAWKQAEQMQNSLKRSELFHEIFPSLVDNDPQAARLALSRVTLSPVEAEYFESMLK